MDEEVSYERFLQDIERGRKVLRDRGINFSKFKEEMAQILCGTENLGEDEWVEQYNNYAGSVIRVSFETTEEWALFFFEKFNKKDHRIWLRKKQKNDLPH